MDERRLDNDGYTAHEVRPVYSAPDAAVILGMSRYGVTQAVKDGRLAGFGFPTARRRRWYVFVDAVSRRLPYGEGRKSASGGTPSSVASIKRSSTTTTRTDTAPSAGEASAAGERDHYRAEAATLRGVALRLNAAVEGAEHNAQHHDRAIQHLRSAVQESQLASESLRQTLREYRQVVEQLLLPSTVDEFQRRQQP